MNIRQAMKIEANASKDIKLSKAAEKLLKYNVDEIQTYLDAVKKDISKLNLNELMGIASNDNLSSEQIREMLKLLNEYSNWANFNIKGAQKTRMGTNRSKVRKLLSLHSNLDDRTIRSMMFGSLFGVPSVLNNPNIKDKHIDEYFQKRVIDSKTSEYNMVAFGKLLKKVLNISPSLLEKWYFELKPFADWKVSDNNWYFILNSFLDYDSTPFEVLKDIAENLETEKTSKKESFSTNWFLEKTANHKNSNNIIKEIAYNKTEDEEYLSNDVKDLFLF